MALDNGTSQEDLLLESVRVAEMHAAVFLYADALTKFDHWNTSLKDQQTATMLRRMTSLWGFHVLLQYSDQGFKEGYLTAEQVKGVEREYLQVCISMMHHVVQVLMRMLELQSIEKSSRWIDGCLGLSRFCTQGTHCKV